MKLADDNHNHHEVNYDVLPLNDADNDQHHNNKDGFEEIRRHLWTIHLLQGCCW